MAELELELRGGVGEIPREQWNALVAGESPFLEWEWLASLEEAGCVGEQTGWAPRPLLLREAGELIAACPLYLKGHSEGEFVFDWGWADAAQRAGFGRAHLRRLRHKHHVRAVAFQQAQVALQRARVGVEVVVAVELQRVDEHADGGLAGHAVRRRHQFQMAAVQIAHRRRQRNTLALGAALTHPLPHSGGGFFQVHQCVRKGGRMTGVLHAPAMVCARCIKTRRGAGRRVT